MGLDGHTDTLEDLGPSVEYDDEIRQPSSQFRLTSLRMGLSLQGGFVITSELLGCYLFNVIEQMREPQRKYAAA